MEKQPTKDEQCTDPTPSRTNNISDQDVSSPSSRTTDQVIPSTPNSELLHDVHDVNPRGRHMQTTTLPHDLKYVKTSELLPMAYDDFTKCLEEDVCRSSFADDDCVVPSVSPSLARTRYYFSSSSSVNSSDESQGEYFQESQEFSEKRDIEQSPSLNRCSPFGTLNWGLTPTIIYKTPGFQSAADVVGNGCMKCSITEGNVELITPPPLKRSKLRIARKRTLKSRRRRIDFGEGKVDEGVQEVPNDEQDSGKHGNSDSSREDPMWFDEDYDWEETVKDQNTSGTHSDEIKEYIRELQKLLPVNNTIEGKSKTNILNMAAQHIQALQQRIKYLTTCVGEVQEGEPCRSSNFPVETEGTEDFYDVLPQFSWSDIDETSYEIQAILNSPLDDPYAQTAAHPSPSTTVEKTNKKRKYTKRKKTGNQHEKSKRGRRSKSVQSSRCNSQEECNSPCPIHISPNRRSLTSTISLSPVPGVYPFILPKPTPPLPSSNLRRLSPAPVLLSPSIPLSTSGPLPISPLSSPYPRSPLVSRCVPMITPRVPLFSAGVLPLTNSATAHTSLTKSIMGLTQQSCWWDPSDSEGWQQGKGDQIQKKKTIPNGYMLYCKEKRARLVGENPDLSPGGITKLLSENWNQFTKEEKRPYQVEATTRRHDENEWKELSSFCFQDS